MKINCNNNLNFKSGLTREILKMEKSINPGEVEKYFSCSPLGDKHSFSHNDFKGNKAHATASRLCADVFINLRKIVDLRNGENISELIFPQDLYVFNNKDSSFYKNLTFFTLNEPTEIESNQPKFNIGTVFMTNKVKSLKAMNDICEDFYSRNETSSPHFLSTYIHEWFHSFFNRLVRNKTLHLNNDYDYQATMQNYFEEELTPEEKEVVINTIGDYPITVGVSQYAECYAEAWTKFVCDALAPDCRTFAKNPLDLIKKTSKEFQEILKKVSNVELLK